MKYIWLSAAFLLTTTSLSHAQSYDLTNSTVLLNGSTRVTLGAELTALANGSFTNVTVTGTGALTVPVGTTTQEPDSGNAGEIRYNSTTGRYEFGISGSWVNYVRLTGDTMTGALTVPGVTVNGTLQANDAAVLLGGGELVGTWGGSYTFSGPTITGGTINNAVIGGTVSDAGTFTTLTANGAVDFTTGGTLSGTFNGGTFNGGTFASPTLTGTVATPDGGSLSATGISATGGAFSGAVALTGGGSLAGTFTGAPTWSSAQTFPGVTSTGIINTTGTTRIQAGNTATSNGILLTPAASGSVAIIESEGPTGTAQPLELVTNANGTSAPFTLLTGNGSIQFGSSGSTGTTTLYQAIVAGYGAQVASSTVTPVFQLPTSVSGSVTSSPAQVFTLGNLTSISSDNLAAFATNQFIAGSQVIYNFGGAAMTGNRQALRVNLVQTAATANTLGGTLGFYVGGQFGVSVSYNDAGTGNTFSAAHGRAFSANFETACNSGATFWYQCSGPEFDADINTGASAYVRSGISIASLTGTVQGTGVDAGIWMYIAGGTGFQTGLQFGSPLNPSTSNPVASSGQYLGDVSGMTTAYGIHFVGTFSTASISVPGFTVNGSGVPGLTLATWADTQTCAAGQISVDANYVYVCTATNTVKRTALSTF